MAGAGGFLYVSDSRTARIQKFTTSGVFLRQWSALQTDESGSVLGAIAVAPVGRLFVADARVDRIEIYTGQGEREYWFGGYGPNPDDLECPQGLAFDSQARLLVSDD